MLSCSGAPAAEIIKIKPGWVLIQLDGETVSIGQHLNVVDTRGGQRVGLIRVSRIEGLKDVINVQRDLS